MTEVVRVDGMAAHNPSLKVSLRCPFCRQQGTLEDVGTTDLRTIVPVDGIFSGQRRCPNPTCHGLIFFVYRNNKLWMTYPAETLDFDSTALPQPVLASLEEAILCHSTGCYSAAAIMIRKTLEEICRDRGATGANLHARLSSLAGRIILPKELLAGLEALRLLGNDAAHFESRVFDEVGRDEVELALAVTKEVLKGVYQYASLIQKLEALKKP